MNVALKVAIAQSRRTQRALSRTTGIPEVRLSNIVRGALTADAREVKKLARALGRPAEELGFDVPAAPAAV